VCHFSASDAEIVGTSTYSPPLHICPACGIMLLCANIFGSVEREGLVSQHDPTAVNIFIICLPLDKRNVTISNAVYANLQFKMQKA